MPAARPLTAWLAGTWSVTRDINDGRGSYRGRAWFTPGPDGGLRWHEAGELTLDGATVPTHRTMAVDADGQVRFDDGRAFHHLALVDGACDAFHACAPDAYTGRYEVIDDDAFAVTWRVRGPDRDDAIRTHYTRSPQSRTRRPISSAT